MKRSIHCVLRKRRKPLSRNTSKMTGKLSKIKGNPKAGILSKHLENAVGSSGSGAIQYDTPVSISERRTIGRGSVADPKASILCPVNEIYASPPGESAN